jgi:uncharacterized protein YecE (DUF72 family)
VFLPHHFEGDFVMVDKNKIHIGTSGWHYDDWIGFFYPEGMVARDYLKHYTKTFKTVEINNTFYQLPQKSTVKDWGDIVPKEFSFAPKASRYITHMKKLKDPEQSTKKFFDSLTPIKKNTGPILFQLPPRFKYNHERLEQFLESLPNDHRYAFEFRDEDWFNDKSVELLKKYNAAFCIYYIGDRESPKELTADFSYIRYHGPDGLGQGYYSEDNLKKFADEINTFVEQGCEIYAYFNNDNGGNAPQNAQSLLSMF